MTSEAQRRAVRKYKAKLKRIPLDVRPDFYALLKSVADSCDESINAYIKNAISMRLEMRGEKDDRTED